MTCFVEIFISTANFGILHAKYLVLPYMYVRRNEVTIEWYSRWNPILQCVKKQQPAL